jgi:hypothetical protein
MKVKHVSFGLAGLALIGACGGPVEDAPASASEARETSRPAGPVNAFSFEETGAAMRQTVPDAADLKLAGGCDGTTPINLSMFLGQPIEERWFSVAFSTEGVVAPGETGTFPLQSLQWDDGVMRPENLPADSPARVPVRYSGKGTLTLDTHAASTGMRRMAGTLTGHVEQLGKGPAADITAHFDINLSCGVK